MSIFAEYYATGTIAVTNGSTAVTLTGGSWNDVVQGDVLEVDGRQQSINSLTDITNLVLMLPYGGTTAPTSPYVLWKSSKARFDPSLALATFKEYREKLAASSLLYSVPEGENPDNSIGNDGQIAIRIDASGLRIWKRISGAYVFQTQSGDTVHSLASYGGVPNDNTFDNASAVASAAADGIFYVPQGTWYSTLGEFNSSGNSWGPGHIKVGSGKNQAGWYRAVTSEPTFDNADYMGFGGDPSNIQIAMAHNILGASTAGTPATGYYINPNIVAQRVEFLTNSGHNEATTVNDGRTGQGAIQIDCAHHGQGDAGCIGVTAYVDSNIPAATTWVANPAVGLLGGSLSAFVDYVGLFGIGDINIKDFGFDTTGIGVQLNMFRANAAGVKECFWGGIRVTSADAAAIDHAFLANGKVDIAFDASGVTLSTNKAVMTMPTGGRIYFNSSFAGSNYKTTSLGSQFMGYDGTDVVFADAPIKVGPAAPAGGSNQAVIHLGSTAGFGIYYGSGVPTFAAATGSIYLRTDATTATTRLYVRTNSSTWATFTASA